MRMAPATVERLLPEPYRECSPGRSSASRNRPPGYAGVGVGIPLRGPWVRRASSLAARPSEQSPVLEPGQGQGPVLDLEDGADHVPMAFASSEPVMVARSCRGRVPSCRVKVASYHSSALSPWKWSELPLNVMVNLPADSWPTKTPSQVPWRRCTPAVTGWVVAVAARARTPAPGRSRKALRGRASSDESWSPSLRLGRGERK